jgi:hypothetical protein
MEHPSSTTNRPLSTMQSFSNSSAEPPRNPDEINLLEYLYVLVKHKKLIIGVTLAGLVLGFIAALIMGPTWVAEAVIAPKETETPNASSLTELGALGGLVASQLNLGGNASLDKIDLILESRDFGAKLIDKYSFLPVIYRYQWPRLFRKYWDPSQNKWKPTFDQPKPLDMGSYIKTKYLKKVKDTKMNTLVVKIQSKDSAFTINLATMYVDYLNDYIKADIQNDARENVAYLDTQLVKVMDPLLREKILGLIANEIEKEMVVSKEAFKVVDPVYLVKNSKAKKLYPLIFGLGIFFITSFITFFIHLFASLDKAKETASLIEQIKQELFPAHARKKH